MDKRIFTFLLVSFFYMQSLAGGVAITDEPDPNPSSMDLIYDYLKVYGEKSLEEIPVENFNRPVKKVFSGDLLPFLSDNDVDGVIQLIASGIDVNADITGDGTTPLMMAESPEMVIALLDQGADVNYRNYDGATALHYAISAERAEELLSVLLDAGADVNAVAKDLGDATPLLSARYLFIEQNDFRKAANIVRLLYRNGAIIDAQDSDGYTALITAAVNNKPRMAKLMLALGANAELRSLDGKTALDYAKELGHGEIESSLINRDL